MFGFYVSDVEIREESDCLSVRTTLPPLTLGRRLFLITVSAISFLCLWGLCRAIWSRPLDGGMTVLDPLFVIIGPIFLVFVIWETGNISSFYSEFQFRANRFELRARDHFHHEGVGYGRDFSPVRVVILKSIPFVRGGVWLMDSNGVRLSLAKWATLADRRLVGECLATFYEIPLVDETLKADGDS